MMRCALQSVLSWPFSCFLSSTDGKYDPALNISVKVIHMGQKWLFYFWYQLLLSGKKITTDHNSCDKLLCDWWLRIGTPLQNTYRFQLGLDKIIQGKIWTNSFSHENTNICFWHSPLITTDGIFFCFSWFLMYTSYSISHVYDMPFSPFFLYLLP